MAKKNIMDREAEELTVYQKVKILIKKSGLQLGQLAGALNLDPSALSQVASGNRRTQPVLDRLGEVFKVQMQLRWSVEDFILADQNAVSRLFKLQSNDPIEHDSTNAHWAMVQSRRYQYIPGETAAFAAALKREPNEEADEDRSDYGTDTVKQVDMVYRGGGLQHTFIQISASNREDLILDAHEGEECIICLHGEIDIYIQKRLNRTYFRGRTTEKETDGKSNPIEARGDDRFREALSKTREDMEDDQDLSPWRLESYDNRPGLWTDCEVFTLKAGDVATFGSFLPHGLLINASYFEKESQRRKASGDKGRIVATAVVVAQGSFFAEGDRFAKPIEDPIREEKTQ